MTPHSHRALALLVNANASERASSECAQYKCGPKYSNVTASRPEGQVCAAAQTNERTNAHARDDVIRSQGEEANARLYARAHESEYESSRAEMK